MVPFAQPQRKNIKIEFYHAPKMGKGDVRIEFLS